MALLEGRTHSISPHPGGAEQLEAVERISILLLACIHSESWSWHFQRVEDWWGLQQESCGGSTQDGAQKVPDLWLFLQVAGALTVGFCFPFPVQRRGQQPPVPVCHASLLERHCEAPDHQHVPNGVWIVVGLLNFMAYTLDGVDGKQARRTNSSTPLGELFDHGLDSWACVYFVVTVYSTFGRGSTGVSVFVLYLLLWVVLFSFILSHWEKYNTGILFLPWGYDVSQVTISIVYIVTAFVGVEAWYAPFLFNFLYRDLFTAMIIACALTVTLPMSLYNFYKAYKNNTLKHHSVYEILLPLVSPVLLFLLCTTWIFLSPTDILEVQPRLFYFMVGTAFANISCQLIVCQMSSTRCQPLNWMLLPIAAVLLLVLSGLAPGSETLLLYLLTAFLTLAHIHYGVVVVSQLSRHFNIRPFSLRKPTPD
uniref:Selenoprotein I n=1 Tax=Cyanistes caeruleus TaxID=156563 RepID=A0A8C0VF99_CYACU